MDQRLYKRVCIIDAPCKINLHLRVLGCRSDGFHDLESLFLSLALGDSLGVALVGSGCEIFMAPESSRKKASRPEGDLPVIPLEQNLVYRAFALFGERTGFEGGIKVRLKKRIPFGAGLGGGSSDAASTLLALDFLAGTALPGDVLWEMARELGSDVPFFLSGGAALVEGRGEKVEPLETPEGFSVVLVKPSFGSQTAEAFRLLDEYREQASPNGSLEIFPAEPPVSRSELKESLGERPDAWPFSNDFLSVFLRADGKEAGIYRNVLERLKALGAAFAGLSGSGSCCFGIFTNRKEAESAAKIFAGQSFFSRLTFPLARRARAV